MKFILTEGSKPTRKKISLKEGTVLSNVRRADGIKRQMARYLGKQGYGKYARLLSLFDVYSTDDPKIAAYMVPDEGIIVINRTMDDEHASVALRHEILHEFLTHMKRIKKLYEENPELLQNHDLFNIAADMEISNRGYTDADKVNIRNLKLGDVPFPGWVTEDKYPDWVNMSMEEMYRELAKLPPIPPPPPGPEGPIGGDGPGGDGGDGGYGPGGDGDNPFNPNGPKTSPHFTDQEIDDLKKQLHDAEEEYYKNRAGHGLPNTSPEEIAERARHRVDEIKKAQDDPTVLDRLKSEVRVAREKERIARDARETKRVQTDPLFQFRISLDEFIKQQTSMIRDMSDDIPSPTYEKERGMFVPTKSMVERKTIPIINVYWDVSGSFDNEAKTAGARQAISTLNEYERDHKIRINTQYFADRVAPTKEEAGGGTSGQAVLEDIAATKPTNVIVITDNGVYDCQSTVKVPGAVWILYYDGESPNLSDHLFGKQKTRHYIITKYNQ